jgi:hypothetical protein
VQQFFKKQTLAHKLAANDDVWDLASLPVVDNRVQAD